MTRGGIRQEVSAFVANYINHVTLGMGQSAPLDKTFHRSHRCRSAAPPPVRWRQKSTDC